MTHPDRKKNTKILTLMNVIEFLTLLKTKELPYLAEYFDITLRAAQYTRSKYAAYSDEQIDDAIDKLRRQIYKVTGDYPPRDYEKQASCEHIHCTAFLKCSCTLTIGENDLEQMIAILQHKLEVLKTNKPIEVLI